MCPLEVFLPPGGRSREQQDSSVSSRLLTHGLEVNVAGGWRSAVGAGQACEAVKGAEGDEGATCCRERRKVQAVHQVAALRGEGFNASVRRDLWRPQQQHLIFITAAPPAPPPPPTPPPPPPCFCHASSIDSIYVVLVLQEEAGEPATASAGRGPWIPEVSSPHCSHQSSFSFTFV